MIDERNDKNMDDVQAALAEDAEGEPREAGDQVADLTKIMKPLKFQDPIKEITESMRSLKFQDPIKEITESMRSLKFQDPMKEITESMRSLKFQDPIKEITESMRSLKFQDPMKEITESMRSLKFQDPIKEITESMRSLKFQDPIKEITESIRSLKFQDPIQKLPKHIARGEVLHDISHVLRAVSAASKDWNSVHYFSEFDEIGPDQVDLSNHVTQEHICKVLIQISASLRAHHDDIETAITKLIDEVHSLKDTRMERLVWFLIIPLLLQLLMSIINPVIALSVQDSFSPRAQASKTSDSNYHTSTDIDRSEIQQFLSGKDNAGLRVVRARKLRVYSGRSRKTRAIARLNEGQFVFVILKHRKWCFIAVPSEVGESEPQYGWVLSKWLLP